MVIWHWTNRKETCCSYYMGYFLKLSARDLLYTLSPQKKPQDSAYHGLCYTSCGTLAGIRNSSVGRP